MEKFLYLTLNNTSVLDFVVYPDEGHRNIITVGNDVFVLPVCLPYLPFYLVAVNSVFQISLWNADENIVCLVAFVSDINKTQRKNCHRTTIAVVEELVDKYLTLYSLFPAKCLYIGSRIYISIGSYSF